MAARGYARARKESRPVARVLSQRGELPGWDMSAARWPQSRVGVGVDEQPPRCRLHAFSVSLPPPAHSGHTGGNPARMFHAIYMTIFVKLCFGG